MAGERNRSRTYPLAPDFHGCGRSDPDHSFDGGREALNGGRLRAGDTDEFAIGSYAKRDLAFVTPSLRSHIDPPALITKWDRLLEAGVRPAGPI